MRIININSYCTCLQDELTYPLEDNSYFASRQVTLVTLWCLPWNYLLFLLPYICSYENVIILEILFLLLLLSRAGYLVNSIEVSMEEWVVTTLEEFCSYFLLLRFYFGSCSRKVTSDIFDNELLWWLLLFLFLLLL